MSFKCFVFFSWICGEVAYKRKSLLSWRFHIKHDIMFWTENKIIVCRLIKWWRLYISKENLNHKKKKNYSESLDFPLSMINWATDWHFKKYLFTHNVVDNNKIMTKTSDLMILNSGSRRFMNNNATFWSQSSHLSTFDDWPMFNPILSPWLCCCFEKSLNNANRSNIDCKLHKLQYLASNVYNRETVRFGNVSWHIHIDIAIGNSPTMSNYYRNNNNISIWLKYTLHTYIVLLL